MINSRAVEEVFEKLDMADRNEKWKPLLFAFSLRRSIFWKPYARVSGVYVRRAEKV